MALQCTLSDLGVVEKPERFNYVECRELKALRICANQITPTTSFLQYLVDPVAANGAPYTSIQTAVTDACNNVLATGYGVISLAPGVYNEDVAIPPGCANLIICGPTNSNESRLAEAEITGTITTESPVTLKSLTIDTPNQSAIVLGPNYAAPTSQNFIACIDCHIEAAGTTSAGPGPLGAGGVIDASPPALGAPNQTIFRIDNCRLRPTATGVQSVYTSGTTNTGFVVTDVSNVQGVVDVTGTSSMLSVTASLTNFTLRTDSSAAFDINYGRISGAGVAAIFTRTGIGGGAPVDRISFSEIITTGAFAMSYTGAGSLLNCEHCYFENGTNVNDAGSAAATFQGAFLSGDVAAINQTLGYAQATVTST
jgi:hypothetical protein